eukprot:9670698-Alexandrium_andersonii.AAC.1
MALTLPTLGRLAPCWATGPSAIATGWVASRAHVQVGKGRSHPTHTPARNRYCFWQPRHLSC